MKINLVQTIVAVFVSMIISYALYSFHPFENKILLSAGGFIFTAISLILTIGITFSLPRTTTNISVLSGVFFLVALISNFTFTFVDFSVPSYVIVNGVLLSAFISITFTISNAKQ